jgi:hypothetical protein
LVIYDRNIETEENRMSRRVVTSVIVCVLLSAVIIGTIAAERDASKYVGMSKCKMCHKSEKSGKQYSIWEAGPHANAYKLLASEEAKAAAKKLGIDDPQKSGKCLKCHSTAYNWTEAVATDQVAVEDGVTCQSCHGPGADYKSKSVMEDREKCIENGMIYPATKSCKLCHNDTSPTWKNDRYTLASGEKVGFDEKQAYDKIKHPKPAE